MDVVSIPERYAKNLYAAVSMLPWYEFQFLIGTLKTTYWNMGRVGRSCVSIPDRYAKNLELQLMCKEVISVSIPDRYAKNGRRA